MQISSLRVFQFCSLHSLIALGFNASKEMRCPTCQALLETGRRISFLDVFEGFFLSSHLRPYIRMQPAKPDSSDPYSFCVCVPDFGCVWRTQADSGCLQSYFLTQSVTKSQQGQSGSISLSASPKDPPLLCLPSARITNMHHSIWLCFIGC